MNKLLYVLAILFLFSFNLNGVQSVYGQPSDLPIIASKHLFDIQSGFLHPSDVTVGAKERI